MSAWVGWDLLQPLCRVSVPSNHLLQHIFPLLTTRLKLMAKSIPFHTRDVARGPHEEARGVPSHGAAPPVRAHPHVPGAPSVPRHRRRTSPKGRCSQPQPHPLDFIISLTAVNISPHRNVFTYRHISNSFLKLNYLTREIVCFDCVAVLLKPT